MPNAAISRIREFLCNNHERILNAYNTGAQWEIWFQVELAMYFQSPYSTEREKPYEAKSKISADLYIGHSSQFEMVELKVQTSKSSSSSIYSEVEKDLKKIIEKTFTPEHKKRTFVLVLVGDLHLSAANLAFNDVLKLQSIHADDTESVISYRIQNMNATHQRRVSKSPNIDEANSRTDKGILVPDSEDYRVKLIKKTLPYFESLKYQNSVNKYSYSIHSHSLGAKETIHLLTFSVKK